AELANTHFAERQRIMRDEVPNKHDDSTQDTGEKDARVHEGITKEKLKIGKEKGEILMLALRGADRHSRCSLSFTNPMKTSVLSLITALTLAAFVGCQTQKKEETTASTSTGATTTHGASTTTKK